MKIKNIINSILFSLIIIGMLVFNIVKEDTEISLTERRKLAQLPKFTKDVVFSTKLSTDFESYAVDQVAFREAFRTLKSFFNVNIFGQKDNNSYFEKDGAIYKMEYPLLETNVDKTLNVIKNVCDKYLSKANIYSAIIPDKNYYLISEDENYLSLDYEKLVSSITEKTSYMKYIDIFSELSIDSYYKTDSHWRQEKILPVAKKLAGEMGVSLNAEYTKTPFENEFYGVYFGQYAMPVDAEPMYFLKNDITDNAVVFDYQNQKNIEVYKKSKGDLRDPYEAYLGGPLSLVTIENKNATTEKELIMFRDSYGSSLAPLFIEGYEKITLIDIRYMHPNMIENFVEFNNQDVLFIYSTSVLNNSETLK